MDNELEVEQTCHKCGEVFKVTPLGADYIHRYGCFKCREREGYRAMFTNTNVGDD